MRSLLVVCVLVCGLNTTAANAQYPEQFYTNGKDMDAWRADPMVTGRKTTLWFTKEPGDKISYRQSLVLVDDNQPEWAYYKDMGTEKFVGRYSFRLDKYSILPEEARRQDRDDIPEKAFPKPGDLPTVDQLLSGSRNRHKLSDPPPTKNYPRLETSSWESSYFTDRHQRIATKVSFNGAQGIYRFRANGDEFEGTLEDVRYETTDQGLFLIRGAWKLGGRNGTFRFTIAPENLNTFQGEWGRNGGIEGTWSGTRLRE
ncbi:MAG: hypothetical protein ABSE84_17030 [Isosphaeraceae bacterium]|jgi:hypothetical protein